MPLISIVTTNESGSSTECDFTEERRLLISFLRDVVKHLRSFNPEVKNCAEARLLGTQITSQFDAKVFDGHSTYKDRDGNVHGAANNQGEIPC